MQFIMRVKKGQLGIYVDDSFKRIPLRIIGTKPNCLATPLENHNDAQFGNHSIRVLLSKSFMELNF